MPYLRALSSFRDGVRQLAIAKGETALKDILALCDKLRDVDLVPLGVALDDQDGKFAQMLLNLLAHQPLSQTRWQGPCQARAARGSHQSPRRKTGSGGSQGREKSR